MNGRIFDPKERIKKVFPCFILKYKNYGSAKMVVVIPL